MTPGILAAGALLLVCYDIVLCVSFYLEANAGARRAGPPPSALRRPRRLAPDQVTLRHALLFLVQKLNYYVQLVTAAALLVRLYLAPRRTTDRDVALLIVETSLATWTSTRPLPGGGVVATLRVEGFAFPLFPGRHDNRLVVETELRPPGCAPLPEARTRRFELNGVPIRSADEQLSVLAIMTSSVTHPVIHSFNNRLYQSHADPRLRPYGDFFLHGQYLNWCAWSWPGILFRIARPHGRRWYQRVLAHNAELPLPPHDHASLSRLAPYSRALRFLLAARPVLARLCRRYALPVDGEALFLCTILHAVDHVGCDAHTRGHLLRHEELSDRGLFNLIALLFYRPAQHFWTNLLRDKRRKSPLYGELYAELRAIDPWLADRVTLSISY